MAASTSSLPSASCEAVGKIAENTSVNVETIPTSAPSTLAVSGSPAQQQQAGARMLPLLYIQGPPTSMRMGTNATTTSSGTISNTPGTQKVPTAIRSGTTLVTTGTQFIPTLASKLNVTPVISSTTSVTTGVVNKTSTNIASGQPQQHFVIQAPRSSGAGTTGTIVPVSVSTPGKSTIAYLGTFIKPGMGKAGEGQIVLPTGQIMQNANQKLLLANVPLQLPQLTSSSGTNTTGSQQQTSTKVTSLLVPMTIPQVSASKGGMINLKIANGQIHAESAGKNSVTLVREKAVSANSSGQMPPLQPIAKISPKPVTTSNGILLTDATLAPINPDILAKHRKPASENGCETTESTKNNIIDEKKRRSQDLNKCLQEAVDAIFSPSSPKKEGEVGKLNEEKDVKEPKDEREVKELKETREIKDIKVEGKKDDDDDDDEITLIKVLPTKEEPKKEIPDDDVKIELVKPDSKSSVENNIDSNSEDFDPMNALDWKDGIGTLPGSEVKFRLNEFGMMEMVDQKGDKKGAVEEKKEERSEVVNISGVRRPSDIGIRKDSRKDDKKGEKSDEKPVRKHGTDDIYYCEGCGCYGLASEFANTRFCSSNCISYFQRKKAAQTKRERELLQLRLRRRKKRLIQLLQMQKATEDHDIKKPEKKQSSSPLPRVVTTPTPASEEDNISNTSNEGTQQARLPWQMGKSGFSWSKYLEHCKAKAAPVKLFKDPFPYSKNGFRVGMKLEGVDPEHPSYFCVLSVSDVQGYRIRLHFDGYSENYDFWVNADSMDIFPPGWCEKNNHTLHPPRGIPQGSFNWATYLKQSKAQTPPRHLFMNKTGSAVCPTGFRLGMKLEAVDRKNSSLVCVATVSDVMDSRILVHFDSWDDIYDYWVDPTSPYIHPVGWCEEHGHNLTPPNNYKGLPFNWETYLKETKSVAAPARAFKQRPPCGFRKGMKLECVDKWLPMLIRVSSVVDVIDHQIKIHFDGWPDQYSYWVDDTSPDIHPMGWCQKTGHPLEPPITWDDSTNSGECPTPSCRGLGHAKGPQFMTHNTVANCPYALQNLSKDNLIPDRLFEKDSCETKEYPGKENEKIVPKDQPPVQETRPPGRVGRPPKVRRLGETTEDSKSLAQDPDWKADDDENYERRRKKRKTFAGERSVSPSNTQVSNSSATPPTARTGPDLEQLQQELRQAVLQPGYEPNPNHLTPHLWTKHSRYLNSFIVQHKGADASQWTQEDVVQFVNSIPGCENKAKVFGDQQIDGEALLMMAQEDLVNVIGMKLGPAIKLYNSIVLLRQKVIGASS